MLEKSSRISIFTGHFGSGKTETALNYAIEISGRYSKTTVVDLDIVNPYFRTRIVRDFLEKNGIKVVCPPGRLAAADLPALPAAIMGVLEDTDCCGVFDTGGYDVGAVALSSLRNYLPTGAFTLFLVVNTCRLLTRDVQGIIETVIDIEKASRLKINALVSNVHMGSETDVATILRGHEIVMEAAKRLDLPVAFMCVHRDLVDAIGDVNVPVLPLTLFMKPPWYDGGQSEAVSLVKVYLPR